MSDITIKPTQLRTVLERCIAAGENVMITGAPGVGKTQITADACAAATAKMVTIYVSVSDPTDLAGMPFVVDGKGEHLPFGKLREIAECAAHGDKLVIFLDDFGQGTPATQAAAMQLLDRYRGASNVSFIVATNRRGDRAGVTGILEPIKSRFATIVEIAPDLADFAEWWFVTKPYSDHVEPIAFLRFRPELLHKFEPTADITNGPCPRTWAALARVKALGLPHELEYAAFAGAVGGGAAGEFLAFLRVYRELPDLDALLLDPEHAEVPNEPSALYAVATGLVSRVTDTTLGSALRYAERMVGAGQGEFAVLLARDILRNMPSVAKSAAWTKAMSGDIGKLIVGE